MEMKQFKQTKFDSMVTNQSMQLIKAVIPYINNSMGNMLGIFIKFQELQNAAHINSGPSVAAMNSDKPGEIHDMLEDIKEFLSEEEKETFDTVMTIMEMMNMDEGAKEAFMGNYMDMFQGDMFQGDMFGENMFHTE